MFGTKKQCQAFTQVFSLRVDVGYNHQEISLSVLVFTDSAETLPACDNGCTCVKAHLKMRCINAQQEQTDCKGCFLRMQKQMFCSSQVPYRTFDSASTAIKMLRSSSFSSRGACGSDIICSRSMWAGNIRAPLLKTAVTR